MKTTTLTLLAALTVLTACRKDDLSDPNNPNSPNYVPNPNNPTAPPDTVTVGSYFPTYPGSYWIYDTGDTAYTDPNYVLHQYYDWYEPPWWYPIEEEPGYIQRFTPIYHGFVHSGYVSRYEFYPGSYHGTPYTIFQEGMGSWSESPSFSNVHENHLVVNPDTLMNVLGEMKSVSIVRKSIDTDWNPPDLNANPDFWGTYYYFAQDVGIIKATYRSYPDSTVYTKNLVEYFINN